MIPKCVKNNVKKMIAFLMIFLVKLTSLCLHKFNEEKLEFAFFTKSSDEVEQLMMISYQLAYPAKGQCHLIYTKMSYFTSRLWFDRMQKLKIKTKLETLHFL